jgi:serine/threonine protein kinase
LHSIGYVHNDLKLENVLVGYSDPNTVYLIDFGLCQSYIIEETGLHTEKKYLGVFSGNMQFASVNSSKGYNKSRRDDLESVLYLLYYFLNDNKLPWSSIGMFNHMSLSEKLAQRLKDQYTQQLYEGCTGKLIVVCGIYLSMCRATVEAVQLCLFTQLSG